MGGFAIPSLPSMPSMSSVRSLLNTSPPLVYPSNATPRPRPANDTTPTRARSVSRSSARLPASPSTHDARSEWDLVDRGRRGSVHSLHDALPASMPSPTRRPVVSVANGSPVRPGHRRAQSAVPQRLQGGSREKGHGYGQGQGQGPLGRLHEISRNPLASSSCISLPTLCEIGPDASSDSSNVPHGQAYGLNRYSAPNSPLTIPRTRRLSRPTPIHLLESDTSDSSGLGGSSFSTGGSKGKHRSHTRSTSSVPPPNSMLPPPAPLARPPISPRSWSVQDVRPASTVGVPSGLGRRSSLSSTSSVSDVAVLATWSFPASPPKGPASRQDVARDTGQPSNQLRERLRLLSSIDTSVSSSQSTQSSQSCTPPKPVAGSKPGRANPTTTPRAPALGHRHSHSSPNLLPLLPVSLSGPPVPNMPFSSSVHPLLPPPRPNRRPTTSRLRQPNPLSMPVDIKPFVSHHHTPSGASGASGNSAASGFGGGASPGSMISDTRSTGSSGSDVEPLPSPTGSIVSLPAIAPLQGNTTSEGRYGLKRWMRRTSVSSLLSISDKPSPAALGLAGKGEELGVRMKGSLYVSPVQGSEGTEESEEESEDERYLTLDDI